MVDGSIDLDRIVGHMVELHMVVGIENRMVELHMVVDIENRMVEHQHHHMELVCIENHIVENHMVVDRMVVDLDYNLNVKKIRNLYILVFIIKYIKIKFHK